MSRNWYILQAFTGYENKVEREINALIEKNEIDSDVISSVKVPVEEIVEIKDGKKKVKKDKFLPGYVLLEMDLPEIDWKKTIFAIRKIHGCGGFVGSTDINVRPRPISDNEARNILQRCGLIKGEKPVRVHQEYSVGDTVKIIEGPFASFTGAIKEVMDEKEKLTVEVQIFGRPTPVEVNFGQVEKA